MEIILVRHAQPDYSVVEAKPGFNHLAPLSAAGMEQAHVVAQSESFAGAEIVISSPYTRALQTAAIIAGNLALPLTVDIGFHERLPDTKGVLNTKQQLHDSFEEYDLRKGIHTSDGEHHWESVAQQISRIKNSLDRYTAHEKIIIVTHGELIRRFAAVRLPFCGLVQVDYDQSFRFLGWS
ncbi:MAG: phosphoglycerate mutase family protein [Oscillospiraceae bacterium]|nr:phosphoglycerate mutase family protein [Oscillospiraceae bacterium]